MNTPIMLEPQRVNDDTQVLMSYMPVAGFGVLPVNAFVIRASEPVLVDTGLAGLRQAFMRQLNTLIEPERLRWIWITHTDPDHLGNLEAVLAAAPIARVVTTYLGMGKMMLQGLPVDRVYLLNPGQHLDVGDRRLTAVAPPTFDAPETTGLFDRKHRTLFSADCFGALMASAVENAAEMATQELRDGCISWATVDAPWLQMIDETQFSRSLEGIARLGADTLLSSHLPPARGMTEQLLGYLNDARSAPPFIGPDQQALERLLAA